MEYSLETMEEKLTHLKIHLWDLQEEQDNKGNSAMAYTLEHLSMIAGDVLKQLADQALKEELCDH